MSTRKRRPRAERAELAEVAETAETDPELADVELRTLELLNAARQAVGAGLVEHDELQELRERLNELLERAHPPAPED